MGTDSGRRAQQGGRSTGHFSRLSCREVFAMLDARSLLYCCVLPMILAATGCGSGGGRDHETAAWVLEKKGQVEVVDAAGNKLLVTAEDSLPGGAFRVRRVAWDIYPGDRNEAIGDVELARLATLVELEDLDLWTSAVTDAGLAQLAGLTSLKHLNLNETKVTDAGLPQLKPLAKLERLHLSGTQVSDAGLTHLAQMKQLIQVDLTRTRVTKAGAHKLRQSLRGCVVMHAVATPAGS